MKQVHRLNHPIILLEQVEMGEVEEAVQVQVLLEMIGVPVEMVQEAMEVAKEESA
jgi:hypothetical protein